MESSSIEIFDCAISPACLASLCARVNDSQSRSAALRLAQQPRVPQRMCLSGSDGLNVVGQALRVPPSIATVPLGLCQSRSRLSQFLFAGLDIFIQRLSALGLILDTFLDARNFGAQIIKLALHLAALVNHLLSVGPFGHISASKRR